MRRGLFLKYVALFVGLVTGVLVINAALDLYFVYKDNRRASIAVQREKAEAAAQRIEQFVREIERQIRWVAYPEFADLPMEQRSADYARLQQQVQAITELTQLDGQGHEQLRVSRLRMGAIGSDIDRSAEPVFRQAIARQVYFGPLYFRNEIEPYMTVAVAHGSGGGVTVAEVDLMLAWELILRIKIGRTGYAYVVDQIGRLVTHPDISLVLRGTDMSRLKQVSDALAAPGNGRESVDATNRAGVAVLSAHARIPALNWLVFVELPIAEAQQPVIDAGLRALALLVLGLAIAGLAGALLARHMVVPIRALRAGAQRIGGGDLGHRLDIKTGDELEALADQFNRAAGALQESRATLEQRVADRTRELSESLEQQTATADILRVISRSPTDVTPVLEVVASAARRYCGATDAVVTLREGDDLVTAAHDGPFPATVGERQPLDHTRLNGRVVAEAHTIQIPDFELADPEEFRTALALARERHFRAAVAAPILRDGVAIGNILLRKPEAGPFTPRQIGLLETFAAQAVIAIQNVRLFTELRETLEQQTASAEILQVISQSPTDVQPVLDAVAAAAVRFCGAPDALIVLRDGDDSVMRAHHGALPATMGLRRPITTGASGQAIREGRTIQYPDTSLLDPVEHASTLAHAQEYGFRATIAAPLLVEGAAIGAIVLRKPDPGALADRQVELLESFAAQAVIAIQNVRLFTELRETLEQQTATAEVLRVISQSPTDVQPVLNVVASSALRFCGADFVTVYMKDGDGLVVVAKIGVGLGPGNHIEIDRKSAAGRAVIDGRTVHLPDLMSLDPTEFGTAQQIGRAGGMGAVVAAPMMREGKAIGVITLPKKSVEPFTPRQIELLETFAAQAVIAIQNVRLFTELRESLEQQTATAEILRVISRSPTDVQPVLDVVAKAALQFCGADDTVIALRSGDEMVWVAHEGSFSVVKGRRRQLDNSTPSGRAILHGRTFHVPDVEDLDPVEFSTAIEIARSRGWRAAVAAPMLRDGIAIGAINLRKPEPGAFTARQIALLEAFAAQAVIAIQNVRLFTEIQEKSHQLEVASQHKSQFLANMSHELRTPLNAILGYTEMMADGLYGQMPDRAASVLARVQSNGKHLLDLINDVLDLSKIEAGQLVLAREPYSMADLAATAMAATESLARAKGLTLASDIAPGLPTGIGDPRRLAQVLLNLVGNAIKFTDQGGVEIRAARAGDCFEIAVVDSGPGIALADQARIFDQFQQVDNTSTRKKGGTGLGLSISRKIAEMHGGHLTVQSEVGKGSTFKVVLPIGAQPAKDAA